MFKHLDDAIRWIESVERFGDKYNLDRMIKACAMLDDPEKTFRSIHIGGTNGKGSTLTFLKQIYLEAGYRVGTYTSPYLVRFNERITLNNEEISDASLLRYINEIYAFDQHYLAKENDQISFFELLTLIAFLYFRDTKPDIALIEVGLGGTLDATNVILPEVSVITNVGYDHMHVLGNTLEAIAQNKLGIVKDNTPLYTGIDQASILPLVAEKSAETKSNVIYLKDYPIEFIALGMPTTFDFLGQSYTLNMVGLHQVTNASLALLVASDLHKNNLWPIEQKHLYEGIKKAFWPGRFEVFGSIILDGAHNEAGLLTCIRTAKAYFPNQRIRALFAVMQDKEYLPMLDLLKETDEVFFTQIAHPRAEKAEKLFEQSQHDKKHFFNDFKEAFDAAKPKENDSLLIVTGSLYFISEIRRLVL